MRRIKTTQVAAVRKAAAEQQGGRCAICKQPTAPAQHVLDHCHKHGFIRAMLCRNCNGIEGKIKNLAVRGKRQYDEIWFLKQIIAYWEEHNRPAREGDLLHPTFKTPAEKRERQNMLARKRRAAKKEKS